MLTPTRRRLGTWLAALTLTTVLASGCTAGDWRYESPSASGVQADAGPIKARNILVVADEEGTGVLLGTLASSRAVELTAAGVAAGQVDGSMGEPVQLDLTGEIPRGGVLNLQAENVVVTDAGLVPGQLATVLMQFSDGSRIVVETPVMSSEDASYQQAFKDATA